MKRQFQMSTKSSIKRQAQNDAKDLTGIIGKYQKILMVKLVIIKYVF